MVSPHLHIHFKYEKLVLIGNICIKQSRQSGFWWYLIAVCVFNWICRVPSIASRFVFMKTCFPRIPTSGAVCQHWIISCYYRQVKKISILIFSSVPLIRDVNCTTSPSGAWYIRPRITSVLMHCLSISTDVLIISLKISMSILCVYANCSPIYKETPLPLRIVL